MESKHTPGPWAVSEEDPTRINGKGPAYSVVVAETVGYKEAREANARLIAAAPELLEAAKLGVDRLLWSIKAGLNTTKEKRDAKKICAAIRKAETGDHGTKKEKEAKA